MSELKKVAYFDEQTALDYVEIRHKGHYIKEIGQDYEGTVNTKANASAKTPRLLSLFQLGAEVNASAEAQRIVRSTVSNTILTDFIEKSKKDKSIIKLTGYDIELTEETRLTLYAAIMDAINGRLPVDDNGLDMDVSKFGSVLSKLQGYLEFNAIKEGEPRAILRFNGLSFRNNYKPADIINMDLVYYGVHVGTTNSSTLKSLGLDLTNKSPSLQDQFDRMLETKEQKSHEDSLEVYDVIMAGVFKGDK